MSSPQHEPGNHWSLIPAVLGFLTAAMSMMAKKMPWSKAEDASSAEKCPNLMSELKALETRHDARFERIEAAQALDRKCAEERHHELFQLLQALSPKNGS